MNPTKEQLADPKWWNENAPVDATHYACANHTCRPLWVKDGYYSCADEAFARWREDRAPYMHGELICRPSEWTGEGLPPVGTVCEAWHMGAEQGVVEVRYSGECMVLWSVSRKHEQCSASENYTFKVLRTPDQIAAEEREMAVQQMAEDVGHLNSRDTAIKVLYAIYDAGYRKQEQTK